ncbi:hypothetical protein AAC387_Pa02g1717 [Persea americana]
MEAAHLPDTNPSKLCFGHYLVGNDIDQMPDTPRRGSHRRAQLETFFHLPSDDDFSLLDIQMLPHDTYLASFPVSVDSAAKLGESNGGDASKGRVSGNNSTHFRSLFVDAASFESLGLQPLGNDGQRTRKRAAAGGGVRERGVHRHNNSMDRSTSSFEADTLSSDYSKKAMAPDKVAELALIDPKRAKSMLQRYLMRISLWSWNSDVLGENWLLQNNLLAAHSVWVNDSEVKPKWNPHFPWTRYTSRFRHIFTSWFGAWTLYTFIRCLHGLTMHWGGFWRKDCALSFWSHAWKKSSCIL